MQFTKRFCVRTIYLNYINKAHIHMPRINKIYIIMISQAEYNLKLILNIEYIQNIFNIQIIFVGAYI